MLWLVCFDMDLVCIIYNVLSGHIISYFKRSKRVNEQIICLCTSSEENRFTCKISGSMVSEFCFFKKKKKLKEVKGLTNKLYAYALVRKKTGLHANFQVHWCYG